MENNPCEKENAELEEAKIKFQTHLADPLNQHDDFPESFQNETEKLMTEINEKEEALEHCEEKIKKA